MVWRVLVEHRHGAVLELLVELRNDFDNWVKSFKALKALFVVQIAQDGVDLFVPGYHQILALFAPEDRGLLS